MRMGRSCDYSITDSGLEKTDASLVFCSGHEGYLCNLVNDQHTAVMSELGAWSEVKPVTLEVTKICIEVRPMVEKMVGTDFMIYIPVVYRSQVVEGENYLVKVLVDENRVCVHLKIYQSLPCEGGKLSVTGIQYPKPFDDPLIPF